MAQATAIATTRIGSFKNPLVKLIETLVEMDSAYRQRSVLQKQPDCRLSDMGMTNRDVAQAWNPPAMFWH